MSPPLISVFGQTNVGKSTFMEYAGKNPTYGLIEVGKTLRARHPLSYFEGKGAMAHTEQEVWEIVDECKARYRECSRIFIDGQPRLPDHVRKLHNRFGEFLLLWLHTHDDTLETRRQARDGGDEAALVLSDKRMSNDRVQLFPVLWEALRLHVPMVPVDTGQPGWEGHAMTQVNIWVRSQGACR